MKPSEGGATRQRYADSQVNMNLDYSEISSVTRFKENEKRPVIVNADKDEYKQIDVGKYDFARESDRNNVMSLGNAYDQPQIDIPNFKGLNIQKMGTTIS